MYNGDQNRKPRILHTLSGNDPANGYGRSRTEVMNAYLGRQSTLYKGGALINVEVSHIIQALDCLKRVLNAEYTDGLTVPQLLANAFDNNPDITIDTTPIRAGEDDVGVYKNITIEDSLSVPKAKHFLAAARGEHRTIVRGKKPIPERPRNIPRALREAHGGRPFAITAKQHDFEFMQSVYDAFEDSVITSDKWYENDEPNLPMRALINDAFAFNKMLMKSSLVEFTRVKGDHRIPVYLVEEFTRTHDFTEEIGLAYVPAEAEKKAVPHHGPDSMRPHQIIDGAAHWTFDPAAKLQLGCSVGL